FAVLVPASLSLLRGFRVPTAGEIDSRIESSNQLLHRPVTVQTDRIAQDKDAFAAALWREHQKRMNERLGNVQADAPRTGLSARDPWGLRALVAMLVFVAFAFSL